MPSCYLELVWISRYATGFFLDFLEGSDGTAGIWDVVSYTPRELRLSFVFSVSAPRDTLLDNDAPPWLQVLRAAREPLCSPPGRSPLPSRCLPSQMQLPKSQTAEDGASEKQQKREREDFGACRGTSPIRNTALPPRTPPRTLGP
jgi:hypothetical protein